MSNHLELSRECQAKVLETKSVLKRAHDKLCECSGGIEESCTEVRF